jgi:hypothetical protein
MMAPTIAHTYTKISVIQQSTCFGEQCDNRQGYKIHNFNNFIILMCLNFLFYIPNDPSTKMSWLGRSH